MGTQMRAAVILSSRCVIVALMIIRMVAAIIPPMTGEMTQLAAIAPMVGQFTMAKPADTMPEPTTPPTTACVVDTGAPINVARLTHRADASSAAIMTMMKV